jgi:hypothetical protein
MCYPCHLHLRERCGLEAFGCGTAFRLGEGIMNLPFSSRIDGLVISDFGRAVTHGPVKKHPRHQADVSNHQQLVKVEPNQIALHISKLC